MCSHVAHDADRSARTPAGCERLAGEIRAGEVIVITDRGTPVAQLAPIPDRSGYAELCARGRILVAPSHQIEQIVAMLDELAPAEGSLGDALDEMRRDER